MATRFAEADWKGSLQDGQGTMKLGTGTYEGAYTYRSRFEEGPGTNPEELIAAALAGCFSMALSGELGRDGFSPNQIHTRADVIMEIVDGHHTITKIQLNTEADVPRIDQKTFLEKAETAKKGCPVSRLLTGAKISLNARLVNA